MTKRGTLSDSPPRLPKFSEDEQTWMDKENAACNFRDERLKKRFRLLLKQFWTSMGQSIPFACQDWASTKAAYRFFANDHVSEQDILGGHFQATSERFGSSEGPQSPVTDMNARPVRPLRQRRTAEHGQCQCRHGRKVQHPRRRRKVSFL